MEPIQFDATFKITCSSRLNQSVAAIRLPEQSLEQPDVPATADYDYLRAEPAVRWVIKIRREQIGFSRCG